jgi:hypothetical protein
MDIFPDSPDFSEYPEKYPETLDLYLTVVKKFVIFRFDYSPPPLVDILILSIGIRARSSTFEA